MKKVIVIFGVFTIGVLLFFGGCSSEGRRIREYELPKLDLSQNQDGIYKGQFSYKNTAYIVEVIIKKHEITDIKILSSQENKYDKKALAVLGRVIEKQSLDVDAVSGATTSSKFYLIAIYNALTGAEIDL